MVFVRIAGCSVRECHIRKECDTDWSHGRSVSLDEIDRLVRAYGCDTVSITGGEPTDHDLLPLVKRLGDLEVHLETSGKRATPSVNWITVSPKSFDYVQRVGDAIKIVVRPEWNWREIDRLNEGSEFKCRYLQPMTTGAHPRSLTTVGNNLEQVTRMVMEHPEWSLSTQAHRTWSMR